MKKQTKTTAKKTRKFQTPHEKKAIEKTAKPKQAAKKSTEPKPEKTKEVQPSKRDALNGIIGSRCSKINVAVIQAGKEGATAKEIAGKTGEDASLVSAQLGWVAKHQPEKLSRKAEGRSFRYIAA